MSTKARRNRPAGKDSLEALQRQVDENYLRLCEKYGWRKPGKWKPRPMAAGKAVAR